MIFFFSKKLINKKIKQQQFFSSFYFLYLNLYFLYLTCYIFLVIQFSLQRLVDQLWTPIMVLLLNMVKIETLIQVGAYFLHFFLKLFCAYSFHQLLHPLIVKDCYFVNFIFINFSLITQKLAADEFSLSRIQIIQIQFYIITVPRAKEVV